jgi:hypothetical protein
LEAYMEVNPRIPSRKMDGALKGPVVAEINKTLTEDPENMTIA